ncbi:hypothetical protein HDV05_007360, partial [Chytridiales sp. JEL 0842]
KNIVAMRKSTAEGRLDILTLQIERINEARLPRLVENLRGSTPKVIRCALQMLETESVDLNYQRVVDDNRRRREDAMVTPDGKRQATERKVAVAAKFLHVLIRRINDTLPASDDPLTIQHVEADALLVSEPILILTDSMQFWKLVEDIVFQQVDVALTNFSPPVNTPLPILNFWNALPGNDHISIVDDASLLHAFLTHQDATMHTLQQQLQQQQEVLQQQLAALGDLQHAQQVTATVPDSAHGNAAHQTALQTPPQHQHHQNNRGSSSASGSGVAAGRASTSASAATAALDEQQLAHATLTAVVRRLESKSETAKTKLKIMDPDPFCGDHLQRLRGQPVSVSV